MRRSTLYLLLVVAIVIEVIASTALARSHGFTRLGPALVALGGYAVTVWMMSQALRLMAAGVVYSTWSGLGIVLIAAVAWLGYSQRLDEPAILGLGLIVTGVVVNVFSQSLGHRGVSRPPALFPAPAWS